MKHLRVASVVVAVAAGLVATACSTTSTASTPSTPAPGAASGCSPTSTSTSSGPPTTRLVGGHATVLHLADIPAAVHAVEAARRGPQRYTEVNATTGGVNVFVALDGGKESSYFYDGCRLSEAGAPLVAQGTTFALEGASLDVVTTLPASVEQKLPGSLIENVALVDVAPDGVVWAVRVRAAKGGLINLRFSPAGALISAVDAGQ